MKTFLVQHQAINKLPRRGKCKLKLQNVAFPKTQCANKIEFVKISSPNKYSKCLFSELHTNLV